MCNAKKLRKAKFMIAIIDYGAGNIFSVANAFKKLNTDIELTNDRDTILAADKVVLPGVGSFADAMANIKKYNLKNTIYDVVDRQTPFLGICVGLQMCFESSEEGNVEGLGIFKGKIKKFPIDICKKVPQIGWNNIDVKNIRGYLSSNDAQNPGIRFSEPISSPIFKGITDNFFYFVHSYYLEAENKENVSATASYGIDFDCAYSDNNVHLTQFHPEKSGKTGLKLLENFINLT
jgi:glutamine amidotransferase